MKTTLQWCCLMDMCTATIPFCPSAKMTKWCVPEPKKSSTSLRLRKSTSCDHSDSPSEYQHDRIRPSFITCDPAYSESHLWSCDPVPFSPTTDTPDIFHNPPLPVHDQIKSASSLPVSFYHTETGILSFQTGLDVAREQEVDWSDPFKHMDYQHCHYRTGPHLEV